MHIETKMMYAEINYAGYGPSISPLPQYGLGNQFFESTITSTSSGSYGLYYGFDGTTLIAQSWLINPTDTYQEALIESYSVSANLACPSISNALFGTTGSDDSYNNSTRIGIIRHGYDASIWGTEISTTKDAAAPYHHRYWVDYSAYHAYGG